MKEKSKTKKKNPKGKLVKHSLKFNLTDEEKAKRGLEAADLNADIAELTIEKKIATDEYSAKIKDRTARRNDLLKQVKDGVENREVECIEVKNFDAGKVEYYFEGEKMHERELTEEDKQLELDEAASKKSKKKLKEKAATAKPQSDEEKKAEEAKACVAVPGKKPPRGKRQEISAFDRDIAETHREETSRNGSYSALNGARM